MREKNDQLPYLIGLYSEEKLIISEFRRALLELNVKDVNWLLW